MDTIHNGEEATYEPDRWWGSKNWTFLLTSNVVRIIAFIGFALLSRLYFKWTKKKYFQGNELIDGVFFILQTKSKKVQSEEHKKTPRKQYFLTFR